MPRDRWYPGKLLSSFGGRHLQMVGSTFYVGQTVKILGSPYHAEFIGKEATVVAIDPKGRAVRLSVPTTYEDWFNENQVEPVT